MIFGSIVANLKRNFLSKDKTPGYEQVSLFKKKITYVLLIEAILLAATILFYGVWYDSGVFHSGTWYLPISVGGRIFQASLLILLYIFIKKEINALQAKVQAYEAELETKNSNLVELVKEKTDALLKKNTYLEAIFENSANGIVLMTKYGILKDFNPEAEKIFGYTKNDIIGRNFIEFIEDNCATYLKEDLEGHVKQNPSETIKICRKIIGQRKNGEKFPIEIALNEITLDGDILFIAIIKDITEQQNSYNLIQKEWVFTQAMIDAIPHPIFVKDNNHLFLRGNEAFWNMIGKSSYEILGSDGFWFFPPEQLEIFKKQDLLVLTNKQKMVNEEQVTQADGSIITSLTSKAPLELTDGSAGLVGIIHDITEIRRIEEKLKESELLFRDVTNHMPNMLFMTNNKGNISWVNKTFESFSGSKDNEYLGDEWRNLIHPDDVEDFIIKYNYAFESEEQFECSFRMKDHSETYHFFACNGCSAL